MSSIQWSNQDVFPAASFYRDSFFNEPEEWFAGRFTRTKTPAVNVSESDTEVEVELVAPGKSKEDFEVTVSDNILTIRAEDQSSSEESDKAYTRQEYNYSSFTRSFNLPGSVDSSSIDAKYEKGILKITISKQPKKEGNSTVIEVQ